MKYTDFQEKRRFAQKIVVPALIEHGYDQKAIRIAKCGFFKHVALCSTCKTAYFNGASTCKDRFCPVCQKKRSLLWLAKLYPIFDNLINKGYIVNFLTLTIKDTESLKEGLDLLLGAFRVMQHDDKTMSKQFNNLFIGGIRALEVKMGANSKLWHPHLHMLVVKNKKSKDFETIKNMWEKALQVVSGKKEKLGSVDIRNISFTTETGQKKFGRQALLQGICECFKYLTKSSWQMENIPEMIETLAKVHSLSSWGNIRYYLAKQNAEREIEKEMDMTETELEHHVCKVCGDDAFIFISDANVQHMQLESFD